MSKLHEQHNSGVTPDKFTPRIDLTIKSQRLNSVIANKSYVVTQQTFNETIKRMEQECDQRINEPLHGASKEQYLSIVLDTFDDMDIVSTLGAFGPFLLDGISNDEKNCVLQIDLTDMDDEVDC